MTINSYVRGVLVRASATFANAAGTAVDPTTVTFRVRAPNGTITTPSVVKDSVGNYHVDVDANAEGTWHFRWEGAGANQGAAEGQFTVADGVFP